MLLSEPTSSLPIEDQVLEAILAATLPPSPAAPTPSGPNPNPNPNLNLPSPSSLAATLRLPLSRILDILANPLTRSRIAAAQELRDLAFHQREQLAREKALLALESILETTDDPIEKRRAATAILRRHSTRNPFWPRTPGAGAATPDDDEDLDEDALPPRPQLPKPEYPGWCKPPRPGLIRLLTRLQDNHNPTPNAGLRTLFNFKDHRDITDPHLRAQVLTDYLEDPGQDAQLTNFSCAILHTPDPTTSAAASALGTQHSALSPPDPANPADPNEHTERITLHWPDHHRTIQVHFKNTGNPWAALWQIAHIDIGPKATSADDSS